ncbi:hypothetical protein BD410DRAFT_789408 [Rickenella mellea]|uniref:Lysine-specific metallo-endopeptidase domain-containing protein n=1 Tax=Rickenella mellea TaxID=50990 RepID=A0A4Y7Q372_9AGAM|nr:hypothetical protein BD410DRAFT_789408 [Rickenella mellea]
MFSKMTLVSLLSFVGLISAHPISRRQGSVTLQVLNDSVDTKLGCNAAQIATLKGALSDAASVAATAAQTLSGVVLSGTSPEAVTTFLGISGAGLGDELALRLTSVGKFYGGALTEITDLVAGNSATTLRFYCPAATTSAQDGNPCEANFEAVTESLSDGFINKMALCSGFFAGDTLASDTTTHNADKAAGILTSFTTPGAPGITLIHEAQHSTPLLGGNDSDILEDIATTVADCAALPATALKLCEKSSQAKLTTLRKFKIQLNA